ncbi:MAG: hypothetical protein ABJN36_05630 [Cyclobacteriaceae bacterium]
MKLKQKTLFSTVRLTIVDQSLTYKVGQWMGGEESQIHLSKIGYEHIRPRRSVNTATAIITCLAGIVASYVLFSKFKVYSNLDSFVVLCGFILILVICFRVIQSSKIEELVIPILGDQDVTIRSELPDKEAVVYFILDLQNACKKYWLDRKLAQANSKANLTP